MADTLSWLVLMQVVGLIGFPFAYILLRPLTDGGYAFSKVMGLLVLGYLYWLGGSTGLLPNDQGALALLFLVLAIGAAGLAWLNRADFSELLRRRWRVLLAADLIFAAAFLVAAFFRSYVPEIDGTEKPMDFAFLNAVLRADSFPPEDPWLAGHGISYYYFGHLIVGMVTQLSGVGAAVGFNLGVALVAALAATAAFGVVWNLVAGSGRIRAAYACGLAAVGLLLVVSNWEGLFELMAVHDLAPGWLYGVLDIDGLEGSKESGSWYPTEFWFWWRATRIVSGWTIREFPFFSFLLGDLHAHVLALPFFMTALAMTFSFFRSRMALTWRTWQISPAVLLLGALVLGSLVFLNAWDLPTMAFIVLVVALAANLRAGQPLGAALGGGVLFLVPLVLLAIVLFLPFLDSFGSAAKFVAPVMVTNKPDYVVSGDIVSRPVHLLLAWGPLLWLGGLFAAVALWRSRPLDGRLLATALLPFPLIVSVWSGAVVFDSGPSGLLDEVVDRGAAWLSTGLLAALTWVAGAAALRQLQQWMEGSGALLFALAVLWVGFLLILGAEFFYVEEFAAARINTLFKLSFQAWILLAIACAYGLLYLWDSRPRQLFAKSSQPASTFVWPALAAVTAVFIGAALVYPVISTANRTEGLTKDRTLDGLAYVRTNQPGEYEAIRWFNHNVDGSPVILEAPGDDWGDNSRISWRTGLPTLRGWPVHEFIWRGTWEPQEGREEAINAIYIGDDREEIMELLDRYDVEYVVLGVAERALYGPTLGAALGRLLAPVAELGSVTIYEVVDGAPTSGIAGGP
jgi:YYY domain-containing protein